MRRPAPQTLAAIVGVAALGFVAIVTARGETPAYDQYSSTDYRPGGYRAWAELLGREGIGTARFVLRPIELDGRVDTLISAQPPPLAADPGSRTAADIGALAAWVRRGGRLVYLGRNAALDQAENRLLQLPFFLPNVGPRGALTGQLAGRVPSLAALGTNRMLLIEHSGSAQLADRNGDIVVRYPLGRGEIVAAVDPVPFTNANIATRENARLAYLLGVPRRTGGSVAFDDGLHGALIDRPWYRALPVPVRVSLGIAGLALLLALAGSMLRGGSPMRLEPPREPTSVEFVEALAALHERTRARAPARAVLARDALAAAARAVGLGDDVAPRVLVQRIGDRGGGPAVRRLVDTLDAPIATDADLLAGAKLAHIVRKDWTHGGNGDRPRAAFAGRTRARRRW